MKPRELAKRLVFKAFFVGDRGGVHILPSHYYSSLPSWRWLRKNEERWRKPVSLTGIHWDLDEQARWMCHTIDPRLAAELDVDELVAAADAVGGFRYGPIEALTLYSVVRARQPRRIVEIGSGSSTLVMSRAVDRNIAEGGRSTEIRAIDPHTAHHVESLPHVSAAAMHGIDLTLDDLDLEAGDLLFLDSTHAVRTGGEVPHIYLNLLPALPPGVLIHIHDIYLPYLYTPELYTFFFDWQETALLAALLVNNDRMRIRAAMAAIAQERPAVLAALYPGYRPAAMDRGLRVEQNTDHYPTSLWLETVA